MNTFSKRTGWLLMLLVSLIFSCNVNDDPDPEGAKDVYVKAVFTNPDGSVETTRVKYLKYDAITGAPLRVLTNLQVYSNTTLTGDEEYGVIEIFGKKSVEIVLTIDGKLKAGDLNFNNSGNEKILVHNTVAGQTIISSSVDMNGDVHFVNNGELETGSVEMQNGKNLFENNWFHKINGDLQISDAASDYHNCKILHVSNYTSLHAGRYISCNCGVLITFGLNVDGTDKVEGEGFIEVLGNMNLNGHLTKSDKILLKYTYTEGGVCKQKSLDGNKLGAAIRVCENTCGGSLPVRYVNLKWATFKDGESVFGEMSLDVTENSGIRDMKILTSSDGKTWKEAYTETDADAFVQGQSYKRKFRLD